MQTKSSSNQQEKKKVNCINYMKGMCLYGESCRYQHPPKQKSSKSTSDTKKSEVKNEVCSYYLQNKCKRGQDCPFLHVTPKSTKLERRSDWLTFCLYYPSGKCRSKECRFLHVTKNDEDTFCETGKINGHLIEQAMCKALLQDVSFNGNSPVCRDLLQGSCETVSCPCLHLSRQAYTEAITAALIEKFESVFGPQETYLLPSARMYHQSDNSLYDAPGCNALSAYGSSVRDQRQAPFRRNYDDNESCKPLYENTSTCHNKRSKFNKEKYISSESDHIINEMYSLMKDDINLIRNADRQEIYDLREKLNSLTDENRRHLYEFAKCPPYKEDHRKSGARHISKEEMKYQDMIRKLEKENLEMRRKLAELEEEKLNPHYMGRPGSSYLRQNVGKDQLQGVDVREHGDHSDTMGDEGNGWYSSNPGGTSASMADRSSYKSHRHKVQSQLQKNMVHQYSQPQTQQYQEMGHSSKTVRQRYHKSNHYGKKEVQQHKQPKSVPKGQKHKKKQGESKTSDQVNSVKPKMPKSMSDGADDSKTCDLLQEQKLMNESFQDSHTKESSYTRTDEKPVNPKEIPKGKLDEENTEEIKTEDETLVEDLSEIEVKNESAPKDEKEKDKISGKDDKSLTPEESELDKENSSSNTETTDNSVKESCDLLQEKKLMNESLQDSDTKESSYTRTDEKPVTPKEMQMGKLDAENIEEIKAEDETPVENFSEREVKNEIAPKDETEKDEISGKDDKSLTPKESELAKENTSSDIATTDNSVKENLSGNVIVNESAKEDDTEGYGQARKEENLVQNKDATKEPETTNEDPGDVKGGEEKETKTAAQDVLNQEKTPKEEGMEKNKGEN